MAAKPKDVHFSVDSQLIGELGERLVARNYVALAELIKNAYDADSTSVTVTFESIKNSKNKLVPSIKIVDDGVGMSFSDVDKKWMRIATDNKSRYPTSSLFGRPKTGNKGIGRFACQRLAHELRLTTTTKFKTGFNQTVVDFIWADFVPGKDLAKIPCKSKTRFITNANEGTCLELIGLRERWLARDFDTLRRSIADLAFAQEVKRKNFKPDPGFAINLKAPGQSSGAENLLNQVMDSGWGLLSGHITSNGQLTLKLDAKFLLGTQKWSIATKNKSLAGVGFEIAWVTGRKTHELNRNPSILKKGVVAKLREQMGVRVYNEGFRVFPLGERGNDWLGLDRDYAKRDENLMAEIESVYKAFIGKERAGLFRPRNENLLGRVFIHDAIGKGFSIKMDREGFVDNKSYRDLKQSLRLSIDWMTVQFLRARSTWIQRKASEAEEAFRLKSKQSGKEIPADRDVLSIALDYLTDEATRPTGEKGGAEAGPTAKEAENVIRARYEQLSDDVEILRAIASSAPLLFMFAHEVHGLIGQLRTGASSIKSLLSGKNLSKKENELNGLAEQLNATADSFNELYGLFNVVAQVKASRPEAHYVRKIAESLLRGTKHSTQGADIEVRLECSRDLKTPRIRKAEFVSILANLYSNALKSCYARKHGEIEVEIEKDEDFFKIIVRDTGVGLPKEYWEEVTKPFVSDPAGRIYSKLESRFGDQTISELGRGSGLGLSIVKGIVDAYKGRLDFASPKGWALEVTARIPLIV